MTTINDLLNIPNPGDPEFAEYAFELTQGITRQLSDAGWKFIPRQGPRGHYYDGIGPKGRRIMSKQLPTQEDALLAAIRQANGIQHPLVS